MNIDLFKYILKLSVIPMLFLSLLLITHGADDDMAATRFNSGGAPENAPPGN